MERHGGKGGIGLQRAIKTDDAPQAYPTAGPVNPTMKK